MEQKREFVEIIFTNDIGRTLYNTCELTYDSFLSSGKNILRKSQKSVKSTKFIALKERAPYDTSQLQRKGTYVTAYESSKSTLRSSMDQSCQQAMHIYLISHALFMIKGSFDFTILL